MKVWLDGQVVDESEARVSVFDHGLTVGDGVFETAKVVDGQAYALTRHLARLQRSAQGLGLEPPDPDVVRAAVEQTLAANAEVTTSRPHRLRITLTGGPGPLGSERGGTGQTLVVALAPMAPWAPTAKVVVVPWTRNERSPLAGLKSTSYADNVIALAHARRHGGDEAVFANTRGELCEGTGSNVFVVIGGEVLTPPLSSGCLAGVTRELVLEWCGASEAELPVSVLEAADEVFLTSSTRDIQGVHAVDGRQLSAAPGPVTRHCSETFAACAANDLDP